MTHSLLVLLMKMMIYVLGYVTHISDFSSGLLCSKKMRSVQKGHMKFFTVLLSVLMSYPRGCRKPSAYYVFCLPQGFSAKRGLRGA